MRTLVHLRHAERQPGGPHLTERGARAAAEVARRLPRFDRAITSPKPRAVETAEAMGYGVARELPDLGGLPDELDRWVVRASPRSFADYAAWVDEVAEARTHAEALAGLLRGELEALADGACLLVVSHGGVVELAAVGAVGTTAAAWGPTLGYLEGVELGLGPSGWVHGRVVRGAR